jgi:hypothetical protein
MKETVHYRVTPSGRGGAWISIISNVIKTEYSFIPLINFQVAEHR